MLDCESGNLTRESQIKSFKPWSTAQVPNLPTRNEFLTIATKNYAKADA